MRKESLTPRHGTQECGVSLHQEPDVGCEDLSVALVQGLAQDHRGEYGVHGEVWFFLFREFPDGLFRCGLARCVPWLTSVRLPHVLKGVHTREQLAQAHTAAAPTRPAERLRSTYHAQDASHFPRPET